jgi:hypothetical protein
MSRAFYWKWPCRLSRVFESEPREFDLGFLALYLFDIFRAPIACSRFWTRTDSHFILDLGAWILSYSLAQSLLPSLDDKYLPSCTIYTFYDMCHTIARLMTCAGRARARHGTARCAGRGFGRSPSTTGPRVIASSAAEAWKRLCSCSDRLFARHRYAMGSFKK